MNLIRRIFAKEYIPTYTERDFRFDCWITCDHPSENAVDAFNKFFEKNHFLIAKNMFDETWDDKIKLEEIFKKLLLIYNFSLDDKNIIIVYKNNKKIYLPNGRFVKLDTRSIFVYDKSKIKVIH